MTEKPTGLALLRAPFPANQISKLPKPTKAQTDAVRADFKSGIRCKVCGAWHHKDVVHLDYVGHAALTDRLLDCDDQWGWEPMALTPAGVPAMDGNGGMWIKLTVCGMTRIGYGHSDGKTGGDAVKEVIGDALRNAAMRFGAALDLWHKGDLHVADAPEEPAPAPEEPAPAPEEPAPAFDPAAASRRIVSRLAKAMAVPETFKIYKEERGAMDALKAADSGIHAKTFAAFAARKAELLDTDSPF